MVEKVGGLGSSYIFFIRRFAVSILKPVQVLQIVLNNFTIVPVSFLMLALSYPMEKHMGVRAFIVSLHNILQRLWRSDFGGPVP